MGNNQTLTTTTEIVDDPVDALDYYIDELFQCEPKEDVERQHNLDEQCTPYLSGEDLSSFITTKHFDEHREPSQKSNAHCHFLAEPVNQHQMDPLRVRSHNFGGASAEIAIIWGLWFKKRIHGRLAMRSSAICLRACGVTVHSFAAFNPKTIIHAIPSASGPNEAAQRTLSCSLETLIGAVICGVDPHSASTHGMDACFERNRESKTRRAVLCKAMVFLLHDDQYDIRDKSKFNDKLLRRIYHKLSALQHPEMRNGDHTQWLRLSAYYGIMSAICEKLHGGKFGLGIGGNSAKERYCADRSNVVAAIIKKSKSSRNKVLCSQSIYR